MKTIGLVGGSGSISTANYYKIINQHDVPVKVFDTTYIHSMAAVSFAIGQTLH